MFLRNYWYVAATDAGGRPQAAWPKPSWASPSCSSVPSRARRWPMEDRCAHRHLPLSMGKLVGDEVCSATITGCASAPMAAAPAFPARSRFHAAPRSKPIRSPSVITGFGSGWAIQRWPIRRRSPISIGSTIQIIGVPRAPTCTSRRTGSSWSTTCSISRTWPSCTTPPSANLALAEHAKVQVAPRAEQCRGERAGSSTRSRRRRSRKSAALPAMSIAGRSSTSCRRPSCGSTSAPRRPAPARRTASASAASACAISTPSRRRPKRRRIILGPGP